MSQRFRLTPPGSSRSSADNQLLITSPQNAHFRRWMSLYDRKGIRKYQQCLVLGKKIILETVERHPSLCREYLYASKTQDLLKLPEHVTPFRLSRELFRTIDAVGTSFPILVCQTQDFSSINLTTPPEGLEVLCPLGDPINLGMVIRSCSAFGVQKLILLKEAAHPFHPKAIRASSGAIFNQPIFQGPRILDLTDHKNGKWIVSLDLKGESIATWQWSQHIRLLVGEEGLGSPKGKFQQTLTIPQIPGIDSLNAAIATSIALFSYRQQFPLSGHCQIKEEI